MVFFLFLFLAHLRICSGRFEGSKVSLSDGPSLWNLSFEFCRCKASYLVKSLILDLILLQSSPWMWTTVPHHVLFVLHSSGGHRSTPTRIGKWMPFNTGGFHPVSTTQLDVWTGSTLVVDRAWWIPLHVSTCRFFFLMEVTIPSFKQISKEVSNKKLIVMEVSESHCKMTT